MDPVHDSATYRRLARIIRANANADPSTRCWRCNLTLAQARSQWGQHITWTAGHLTDGQHASTLRITDLKAEHSRCNYSAGATRTNRTRNTPTSRDW